MGIRPQLQRPSARGTEPDHYLACRVPTATRIQLEAYCQAHGVSISDVLRAGLATMLGEAGHEFTFDLARALAVQMARVIVDNAAQYAASELPTTWSDAVARWPELGTQFTFPTPIR